MVPYSDNKYINKQHGQMSPKLGQTQSYKKEEKETAMHVSSLVPRLTSVVFVSNEIKISAIIPSRVKRVYI